MELEATTTDTPADDGTGAEAPPAESSEAPSTTQAEEPSVELETPWSLDEVDEGLRPDLERYINSARPAVTRKFQEAAELRKQAEAALSLQESLDSPDTAYGTLSELLGKYGIELPEDVWRQATGGELEYDDEELDDESEQSPLEARLEAIEAARQEEQDNAERSRRLGHVKGHFATLAEQRGYGETVDDVPDPVRNTLAAIAASLEYTEEGLPNMEAAQEHLEALEAHAVERYLKAKRPDPVPSGGAPGERRADIRSPEDRLALSQEIAARHYAGA